MTFEKLCEIIADQTGIPANEIKAEHSFKDDLKADSLTLFQIVNDIEEQFDMKIEDLNGIETVADAVKLIENR